MNDLNQLKYNPSLLKYTIILPTTIKYHIYNLANVCLVTALIDARLGIVKISASTDGVLSLIIDSFRAHTKFQIPEITPFCLEEQPSESRGHFLLVFFVCLVTYSLMQNFKALL